MEGEVKKFYNAASNIADFLETHLRRKSRIKINTDTDPDGISAGNIIARCLNYFDIPFHISFGGPPEEEDLKELNRQDYDLFLFLDQGTGQYQIINEYLLEKNEEVLILDHHPGETENRTGFNHLNPHSFNLSGVKDVSSSGVAYSVIKQIDERFESLSEIALIGALGDRQEGPSGFSGINQEILNRSRENDFIRTENGLKLNNRGLPIPECLSRTIRPFLRGLSGNKDKCEELITGLGFEIETTIQELNEEEEKELRDEILKTIKIESPENLKNSLWGTIYISQTDQIAGPKNLNEYVTLLDSCEKSNKVEIGFSAMLGDETYGEKAHDITKKYQKNMIEVMNWLVSEEDRIKTTPQFRYLDIEEEFKSKMIGEILSIAIESGLVKNNKPLIGLAKINENKLKVSARASAEYVKSGPPLGEVLHKISEELEGSGGGHNVAAAARIPYERKDEFIKKVDKFLKNYK